MLCDAFVEVRELLKKLVKNFLNALFVVFLVLRLCQQFVLVLEKDLIEKSVMCPFDLLVSTTGVTRLEILDLLPLSLTEVFVADLRVEVNQVAHFAFKLLLLGFNLFNYRAFLGLVVVSVGLLFAFRVFVFFKVSYTITALGVTSEIKSWRALV